MIAPLATLLIALVPATSGPPLAPDPWGPALSPLDDDEQEGDEQEIERLQAWPELPRGAVKQVGTDLDGLRKAHTPEMAEFSREGLIGQGAGIVPLALPLLAKEKDAAALERLTEVLVAVTAAEHTRLLAAEFEHKELEVRSFCLWRAAAFPDAGLREPADAALARVAGWKDDKRQQRKYTEEEHYAAALCASSAGSLEGLGLLMEVAQRRWGERGEEMRIALDAIRGPEATARVAEALAEDDRAAKVAALNLLSGCGDAESAVGLVRPYLDETDNSLRVAAVNALRGIVDGDPPLAKLSVFDAIEEANKWKERL